MEGLFWVAEGEGGEGSRYRVGDSDQMTKPLQTTAPNLLTWPSFQVPLSFTSQKSSLPLPSSLRKHCLDSLVLGRFETRPVMYERMFPGATDFFFPRDLLFSFSSARISVEPVRSVVLFGERVARSVASPAYSGSSRDGD
jgi:hypothetical protein